MRCASLMSKLCIMFKFKKSNNKLFASTKFKIPLLKSKPLRLLFIGVCLYCNRDLYYDLDKNKSDLCYHDPEDTCEFCGVPLKACVCHDY